MTKRIYMFSGEGTGSPDASPALLKQSRLWPEIKAILKSGHGLDLDMLWEQEKGRHECPYSSLITLATEICLADQWALWGYKPDGVIGHSTGELAASYLAGFYSLETVFMIALRIGEAASNLTGVMAHGTLTDNTINDLAVNVSSRNFIQENRTHVTVSGYPEDIAAFLVDHPDFTEMKPRHPWHHPDYSQYSASLRAIPADPGNGIDYVSGITGSFENRLSDDYWANWLTKPVDFITAMESVRARYGGERLEIIEIGFHPVLDRGCVVFPDFVHVSSMFRDEDEVKWILHQRRKLDPKVFRDSVAQVLKPFDPPLDFETSLAYQGMTSIRFVELSGLLQSHFPFLNPQDFYRYKTLDQLISGFGLSAEKSSTEKTERHKNSVVICGMSCAFPSAIENPDQFWDALMAKKDQITHQPDRGKLEAGYLDPSVLGFDHAFFNISAAESETMDPQQKLALTLAEQVFRDAEVNPETLDKKRVGVYIGAWNLEYRGDSRSVYYPTGTNPSIIASRISYHYDLRGPSWVVNTACSSSLVAIHYAARDIADGRIDFAIAGGVNMIVDDTFTGIMKNAGFLSPENRCKTFDNSADGYVRAEGGGLILLADKRLADRYYAELLGSAVNQNGGRSQVITAPHPEAQEELITDACMDAGIDPKEIAYVECHGTGTRLGDPIEITAIQNTIARKRKTPCYLGSVKSNIGHLESAAGIAGIIKSLLALSHGTIPPNLHFDTPNAFIDFDSFNLHVVSEVVEIERDAVIGISSFGFGGANAHVIVKGADNAYRKEIRAVPSPFDRKTALPGVIAVKTDETAKSSDQDKVSALPPSDDVESFVRAIFTRLTNIESIDPDVELFEQGLDSLSAAELINILEEEYRIELDPDILFDHPLLGQFVKAVEAAGLKTGGVSTTPESVEKSISRDDVAAFVKKLFTHLTNIKTIDPEVALTDQGMNSLSVVEFVTLLEEEYKLAVDPDIIFDYPLYDQLVDKIHSLTG